MNTFLAVTFFFRILTFAFAIGGGPTDSGNDFTKCDDVRPMSGFNSKEYFKKLKHLYTTHARYGGRLGVCREFHVSKDFSGTIRYNFEFNGNGKHDLGINSYVTNCTGTEDTTRKGKFSFSCIQKYDLDLDYMKEQLLKDANTDQKKAEVEEIIKKMREGDNKEDFTLKVTVLSTDYEKYTLIHRCGETLQDNQKNFVDNYVVLNVQEGAGLPNAAKQKFKEYKWEENTFVTREMCKNAGSKKKV
ncbi:pallidipin-like [Rhodnius prolixus]|uniref:pallidipin-like n=1 Tax=Rhodnius prolixus TaxID=13249 RepID=UPI003D18BE0D